MAAVPACIIIAVADPKANLPGIRRDDPSIDIGYAAETEIYR
jgi:hypothetical protein